MPIVTINGLESVLDRDALVKLCGNMKGSIANIGALELTPEDISVFITANMVMDPEQRDIIVTIDGLFVKKNRTGEIRLQMARVAGEVVRNFVVHHCGDRRKIEILVSPPYDPRNGFVTLFTQTQT